MPDQDARASAEARRCGDAGHAADVHDAAGASAASPARYGVPGPPATVYLIRHGETEWNAEGRMQGWLDTKLSLEGRRQAAALRARLAQIQFDAVYSSDLSRCLDTARIALAPRAVDVRATFSLREFGKGAMEGRLGDELAFGAVGYNAGYGEETLEQALGRIQPFVDYLLSRHGGQTVLIFTHGGIIRALIHRLTGVAYEELRGRSNRNTGVHRIDFPAGAPGRVVYLDDVSHLS